VREFVLLACLKETGLTNKEALTNAVGLSRTTIDACMSRLLDNGLVIAGDGLCQYRLSADGFALLRKADR